MEPRLKVKSKPELGKHNRLSHAGTTRQRCWWTPMPFLARTSAMP